MSICCCFTELPEWTTFSKNKKMGGSLFDYFVPWKRDKVDRSLNKMAGRCANIEFLKNIIKKYMDSQMLHMDEYEKQVLNEESKYKQNFTKERAAAAHNHLKGMNKLFCHLSKIEGKMKLGMSIHATMSTLKNIEVDGLFEMSEDLLNEGQENIEKLFEMVEKGETKMNALFQKLDQLDGTEDFPDDLFEPLKAKKGTTTTSSPPPESLEMRTL